MKELQIVSILLSWSWFSKQSVFSFGPITITICFKILKGSQHNVKHCLLQLV